MSENVQYLFAPPEKDEQDDKQNRYANEIKKRFAAGDVFSAVDFKDVEPRAALDQALSRHAEKGNIARLILPF